MDDDFNFETIEAEEQPKNRTFLYILFGLLGLILVSLIGIYFLWRNVFSPPQQELSAEEATQTAVALTEMALAQLPTTVNTPWPSNTPSPIPTQIPTITAVPPAQEPTITPTIIPSIRPTFAPTPTSLPMTGFADEVELPGLVFLGVVLVVLAIVVRQIRARMAN